MPAKRRTRRLLVLGAASLALILVIVLFGVPWWTGRPWGGTVSDREGRVSVDLPKHWIDATPEDAGHVVTYDDSGDVTDPHRLPDISIAYWEEPSGRSGPSADIAILPSDGAALEQLHTQHVVAACTGYDVCEKRHSPEPTAVDGRPAAAQLLSADTDTIWAVTILDGDTVIRFSGRSDNADDAQGDGPLATVLNTVRIDA